MSDIQLLEARIAALETKSRTKEKFDFRLLSRPVNKTTGATYQAKTNLLLFYSLVTTTTGTVNVTLKTDTASTPTTVVWNASSGTSHGTDTYSFLYPINKGNYYTVSGSTGSGPTEVLQEFSISKYHD